SNNVPVMFIPMPVQQQRWQEFLDSFSLMSALPDIINVRYIVYSNEQYTQERAQLGDKFSPLFQSPDGNEVVLENRRVMPKAWLVPSVLPVTQPQQALEVIQNPQFDPRQFAVIESPPVLPMAEIGAAAVGAVGNVQVTRYEGEKIDLSSTSTANAMLVLGEKYYKGWKATVDGKNVDIQRINYILRGVYLTPGTHKVEFIFDPLPFKTGKYLTLASFALFAGMLVREWLLRKNRLRVEG
ncbi:MAG: YfhO family protein, partial [Deltaproteobacteria bacterium]